MRKKRPTPVIHVDFAAVEERVLAFANAPHPVVHVCCQTSRISFTPEALRAHDKRLRWLWIVVGFFVGNVSAVVGGHFILAFLR